MTQPAGERDGPILIRALGGKEDKARYWRYRVAETNVLSDLRLRELEPFAHGPAAGRLARVEAFPPGEPFPDVGFRCQARGLIGRGTSDVSLRVCAGSLDLTLDGSSSYMIDRNRIAVRGPDRSPDRVGSALSGVCLILALALRGVFVLHASAVLHGGKAIAFAGDSGVGKSTLAAYAGSSPCEAFRRLADDLLPFGFGGDGAVRVWSAFPQLKLDGLSQRPLGARSEYPLRALLLLRPLGPGGQLAMSRLAPAAAAQTILAHTVAARLFPPVLLRRHLELAAGLAERLPVFALDFPHREGALAQVYDLVGRLAV